MTLARSVIKEGSVTALTPSVESFCTRLTLYISPMCSSVGTAASFCQVGLKMTFIVLHQSTTRQVLGRLWRRVRLLYLRIFYSKVPKKSITH